MSRTEDVVRQERITISIDGADLAAHPGETVAAAMLAAARLRFREDRSGRARGPFCNMGTCSECMVWIAPAPDDTFVRRRACMVPAVAGMRILTREPGSGGG